MRLFTRKRLVRVHFKDDSPSIDGIYLGQSAGHYVLAKSSIVNGEDVADVGLDGETWVPKPNVLFMQVLQ